MGVGYVLGNLFQQEVKVRNTCFLYLGLACLSCFLLLRFINGYGDPNAWEVQINSFAFTLLSFINVSKYPPSLDYLLITLGVTFAIWPLIEKWQGRTVQYILTFGQVSLFFYLVHLPVIHLLTKAYVQYRYHYTSDWILFNHFRTNHVPWPENYEFSLWLVYGVWIGITYLLYFACQWYRSYKQSHPYTWLRYL